jgi:uncharacterized membrane protein YphA (DoxX/SURF4 family)
VRLFSARACEDTLQRLFSTFPGGRPGVGLLLLRIALGAIAVVFGASDLTGPSGRTPLVWVEAFVLLLGGSSLIAGFLTPLASLVVGLSLVGIAFDWLPVPPLVPGGVNLSVLLMLVTAIGIALLGPGAFSVDGHLFGRREIVIPPRQREP